MEFFWYVVCSTIESCASFFLMLFLFRYDAFQYTKSIIVAGVLFSLLSYSLRVDLDFNNFFPLITIIVYIIYAFYILKIPLLWATAISFISNIVSFAIQTSAYVFYALTDANQFGEVGSSSARILQVIYAIIVIPSFYYLYKKGVGFSFNFDKFKWKAESIVVTFVVVVLLIALFISFIKRDIYYFGIVALITTVILLYLSFRKERDDID